MILLSFWAGNKVGALAARRKGLDNGVLPFAYVLTATPQMWLGIVLAWLLASTLSFFPVSGAYGLGLQPEWSLTFAGSFLYHWFLPFMALFLVAFGGWAIGMRNLIIYELEADYSQYLQALGAPTKLVRRYAYRNALLPQITGLALALGAVVAGAIVDEVVFGYPGVGTLTDLTGHREPRLLPDAGHLPVRHRRGADRELPVDVAYVIVDPRTRVGMKGRGWRSPAGPRTSLAGGRGELPAVAEALPRRPADIAGAAAAGSRETSFTRCATGSSLLGSTSSAAIFLLAVVGPAFTRPRRSGSRRRPESEAVRGRTGWGRPRSARTVFAQFVYGLRAASSSVRSAAGWPPSSACAVGFTSGYRGGSSTTC